LCLNHVSILSQNIINFYNNCCKNQRDNQQRLLFCYFKQKKIDYMNIFIKKEKRNTLKEKNTIVEKKTIDVEINFKDEQIKEINNLLTENFSEKHMGISYLLGKVKKKKIKFEKEFEKFNNEPPKKKQKKDNENSMNNQLEIKKLEIKNETKIVEKKTTKNDGEDFTIGYSLKVLINKINSYNLDNEFSKRIIEIIQLLNDSNYLIFSYKKLNYSLSNFIDSINDQKWIDKCFIKKKNLKKKII
jgi:hypothetical protein